MQMLRVADAGGPVPTGPDEPHLPEPRVGAWSAQSAASESALVCDDARNCSAISHEHRHTNACERIILPCATPPAHCIVDGHPLADFVFFRLTRTCCEGRRSCLRLIHVVSSSALNKRDTDKLTKSYHSIQMQCWTDPNASRSYPSNISHSKLWHQKPSLWPLGQKKRHESRTCTCITLLHCNVLGATVEMRHLPPAPHHIQNSHAANLQAVSPRTWDSPPAVE